MVKLACVEIELSLFCPEPLTNGIVATCKELNMPLVAYVLPQRWAKADRRQSYSPIGRGALTGIKLDDLLPEGHLKRTFPRFMPENFEHNSKLVEPVVQLAVKKGVTPAQIAIAWVLAVGKQPNMPTIVPIPGSTKPERVRENCDAAKVELTAQETEELTQLALAFEVQGDRYPPAHMPFTNQ